jgi:class 3 adenylate cyclase
LAEIIPSEELRELFLRLYAVWQAHDIEALREIFSAGAHCTIFGSDPDEWYTGQAGVKVLLRQADESSGLIIKPRAPVAYRIGNVGWAAGPLDVTFANGVEVTFRATIVAAIERGQWRIVHWHQSIGQKNEEALGIALTTSIEALEQSVLDDRPDLRPASAPDGTVTIVFTDIESSTALLSRLGDTEFLRILNWHDRIVRDSAQQHRGYVVKSQGDGFMLAFPSAALALRACLVMRDRIGKGFEDHRINIRAGLHSGEAIKRDDDFYGHTVVIAARIGSLAQGGEILASDLVHALARGLGSFKFGEARHAALRGLDGSFALFPVLNE